MRTYRVVSKNVICQIAGIAFGNSIQGLQQNYMQPKKTSNDSNDKIQQPQRIIHSDDNELDLLENDFREQNNSQEYLEHHFYPVLNVKEQDIDRDNYGINKRILNNTAGVSTFE